MPTALERDKLYVVVDVETTGKNVPDGKVIEIAAVKIRAGKPGDTFHSLVNPGEKLSWFITNLTGIDNAMLSDAPVFKDIASDFIDFIKGTAIVAHNASFDYRFIKHELERSVDNFELNNEQICTIKLARKRYPGLRKYNLDHLTELFSLKNPCRHRAYGDAMVTAEFFTKYLLA